MAAKLSAVLLALAALAAAGHTSTTTYSAGSEVPTFQPVSNLLTTHSDDAGPYCYNACYGIDRATAGIAVSWYCGTFINGRTYATSADDTTGTFQYTTTSLPDKNANYEEGAIEMVVSVVQVDGESRVECDPVVLMTFEACYSWMMYMIIDGCNTGGENGKRGGEITTGCLKFTINPNPIYWPGCWNTQRPGFCGLGKSCDVEEFESEPTLHTTYDSVEEMQGGKPWNG